jgi:hypothetical protein
MDEIEAFLDECRADAWFQGRLELADRLESVLTELYLAGEDAEWQAIWDQVQAVLERKADTLLTGVTHSPRCSRVSLSQGSRPQGDGAAMAEGSRRFPAPWRADKIAGGYVIRDANGQALAYVYSRENDAEARQAKMLTVVEARRIAINIARLPELLGRGERD